MQLTGIHHLTAISANAAGNHAFYTGVLGMRLVKRTVNQDDVSAYHLFYADAKASPGTDITFFDFPTKPERHGVRSVSRTALLVNGEKALGFWRDRLCAAGLGEAEVREADGRLQLEFQDPEGQRLAFVDDGGKGEANPWEKSQVPAEFQVRALGPITMTIPDLEKTSLVLEKLTNMQRAREYQDGDKTVHVFTMGEGGPRAELHVIEAPKMERVHPGAGGVHHVAFRTPDNAGYDYWADRLVEFGVPNSGKIDRYYFRSLYFREPGGVLFEIATDGPGFASDEPIDKLGERLALPPFLEPRRAEIEAGLKPLST